MRKVLYDSSSRYEILDENESLLSFRDIPSALAFLRPIKNDPAQMARLRMIAACNSHDVQRLNAEELLKQFASLLVSGKIRILRSLARGKKSFPDYR
jgi:hypothetical protein